MIRSVQPLLEYQVAHLEYKISPLFSFYLIKFQPINFNVFCMIMLS